jgi:hypothetical protein
MYGVEMFADDAIRPFYAKSAQKYRDTMAYPGGVLVPMRVRVTWREGSNGAQINWGAATNLYDDYGRPREYRKPPPGEERPFDEQEEIAKRKLIAKNTGVPHHGPWGSGYGDKVLGDYTIPVADRIPDEFVASLKANKGALRLKFRLKPDGVLFGWDIETGGLPRYMAPGGDFTLTQYWSVKLVTYAYESDSAEPSRGIGTVNIAGYMRWLRDNGYCFAGDACDR